MNTSCHIEDTNCQNFSQNHLTKVTFSPLPENKISAVQKFYLEYIYLFSTQLLRHLFFS